MKIQATTLDAYNLFHKGAEAFGRAEQQGMRIDVDYCEKKKVHLTRRVERLENAFSRTKFAHRWNHVFGSRVNINSNQQLSRYLYGTLKIKPVKFTKSGQGSTDEEALKQLNIPELDDLLEIRKLKKIRDNYLDGFLREQIDGVMHPFFNLNLVKTYRSSSSNPNFQNIPIRDEEAMNICRQAILPRPGHQLLDLDYSGIEVRVSCCYHRDPTLIKYVEDPTSDMHGDMAKQIFGLKAGNEKTPEFKLLRQAAKSGFVFPEFYGDYYGNCADSMAYGWGKLPRSKWGSELGIKVPGGEYLSDHLLHHIEVSSYSQFENHVKNIEHDFWNNRFPVYQKWKDEWWEEYREKGYLDMFTGFRCSGVMTRNEVINTPIQGAAFHCLLWSFIEIDKVMQEEGWRSKLIGQIHDNLVFDVHPDELDYVAEVVKRITCVLLAEAWDWIMVPLSIDAEICEVDEPWNKKKEFTLPN